VLTLVPTPIGNLEDITVRALNALKSASVILCEDTRVTKRLLKLLDERFFLNLTSKKLISFYEHNQDKFLKNVTPSFFDQEVVYVSDAGMPAISDPGAKLILYAQKHNIPYTVLPGASAFVTAYAGSGFLEKEFCFFGFLPKKGVAREKAVLEVLENRKNSILYEAPHRLLELIEFIAKNDPKRELFLAKELTKRFERFFKGEAKELYEKLKNEEIKGEWVVIVKGSNLNKKELLLTQEEILNLSLPKKEKAKLLSKLGERSTKEWYNFLSQEDQKG